MRRLCGALVATALVLSAASMTAAPAGAASRVSCKTATGSAKFTPTLPKSSASHKVSSSLSASGKIGGCAGGSATGGTVTFKIPRTPVNCKSWLTYSAKAKPTSGTEVIKWNGGLQSTLALTLQQVRGKPTQRRLTGTIGKGAFRGYRMAGTINFTLPKNACKKTGLASMTYRQVSATTYTPPVVPPPPPPGGRDVPRSLSG